MSDLTERHIAILRALVQQGRAADCDVGMDVNVLAALLNERDGLLVALNAAEQLATQRLAHIREIEQAVDEGDHWAHGYDGDDTGEWTICNGRDYIAALIADYREGPEVTR